MEDLYIFKFGGSCLKNKESLEQSLKIIEKYQPKGKIIVVTSAFYGVTNQLVNWIGTSAEATNESTSIEVLDKIHNFHQDVINRMIFNSEIKKDASTFIEKKINELKENIPKILGKEANLQITDFILSFGERLSTFIYSKYLNDNNYDSDFFSADNNLIITNNIFGNALPILDKIDLTIPSQLKDILNRNGIAAISGYYGCTEEGDITTLGRGGTDFTATIIAYALRDLYNVKVIFWKDVFGILSANPQFEPRAKLLRRISFLEAKQLAFFGSKVLHPLCLSTADKGNADVELRNYNEPFDERYTLITKKLIKEVSIIKSITAIENLDMVTIEGESMVSLPGSAAKIFSLMGEHNINIKFISQSSSENNITFGVADKVGFYTGQLLASSKYFGDRWVNIRVEHDVSLVAVIGAGMANTPGIAGKVFTALGNSGINIRAIAQGSSELNISFVIAKDDLEKAIRLLYKQFIDKTERTVSFW